MLALVLTWHPPVGPFLGSTIGEFYECAPGTDLSLIRLIKRNTKTRWFSALVLEKLNGLNLYHSSMDTFKWTDSEL